MRSESHSERRKSNLTTGAASLKYPNAHKATRRQRLALPDRMPARWQSHASESQLRCVDGSNVSLTFNCLLPGKLQGVEGCVEIGPKTFRPYLSQLEVSKLHQILAGKISATFDFPWKSAAAYQFQLETSNTQSQQLSCFTKFGTKRTVAI
jgi:hypothetical protein